MSKRIVIRPSNVVLDGHDLLAFQDSESFRTAFGPPTRQRDIKMHPSGTRVAMVWDHLGLVGYEDLPERRMSHIHLAFDVDETPEQPKQPTNTVIDINGAFVTGETTERGLPREGETPIVADFGRHYYFESDDFDVAFHFERRRDSRGRKSGVRRLAFLSFSWKEPSLEEPLRSGLS
jgi:hypothetical protein